MVAVARLQRQQQQHRRPIFSCGCELLQLRRQRRRQQQRPVRLLPTQQPTQLASRAASRSFSSAALPPKSSSSPPSSSQLLLQPNHRTNLIFGANTDVGKTIITTGLIRASIVRNNTSRNKNHINNNSSSRIHYIKPLQCGGLETGGDQGFVEKYVANLIAPSPTTTTSSSHPPQPSMGVEFTAQTLFQWSTPVSPHWACQLEQLPVSDVEVLSKLQSTLLHQRQQASHPTTSNSDMVTYIETAGGVLSPSSSSPASSSSSSVSSKLWKWTVQGDLYRQLPSAASVILIGDGRLGGISSTISAMESILLRGYDLMAILFLEEPPNEEEKESSISASSVVGSNKHHHIRHEEGTNVQAIRDYISSRQFQSGSGELLFPFPKQAIVSLPPIPKDPTIPLYDWYESRTVTSIFQSVEQFLHSSWNDSIYDLRSTIHTIHASNNNNSNNNPIWIPGSTDPSCRRLFVDSSSPSTQSGSSPSIQVIESSSTKSSTNNINSNNISSPLPSLSPSPSTGTITTATATAATGNTNNIMGTGVALESKSIIDVSASWWTQSGILQHDTNHSTSMILAMAATAARYGGHISGTPPASCMIHNPMLLLSQTLTQQRYGNKKWGTHVYYTDDGGTSAVEVAIKMGFKTFQRIRELSSDMIEKTKWMIVAQDGCYHGDTLGAMNVMESYVSSEHPWYQERSFCITPPTIAYQDGVLSITIPDGMATSDDVKYTFDSIHDVMDIQVRCISPKLLSIYKETIEMQFLLCEHRTVSTIGCVILEPLLQCAAGMKFIDPLWQAALMDIAYIRSIPVILDESNNGLYRLGVPSCSQVLLRDPDIVIYSKLLTGGTLPLSAVVTNRKVYDACSGDEFLYGNTLVANPIACASALYALSMYESYHKQRQQQDNEEESNTGMMIKYASHQPYLLFDEERVKRISRLPPVKECFTLGSVLAVKLQNTTTSDDNQDDTDNNDTTNDDDGDDMATRLVQTMLEKNHILIGLNQVSYNGDVVYLMVPPFTDKHECDRITDILYNAIQEL